MQERREENTLRMAALASFFGADAGGNFFKKN